MPLVINGVTHADGDPLLVGGVQAQTVTANGVVVWRNTVAPSAITNFAASDAAVGITCTWSNATGIPTPTYDIMRGTTGVASNVTSGVVISAVGTADYHVMARNSAGDTPSNINSGTGYQLPSAITNFNATDDQVDQITFSWSNASGVPTPTYDIQWNDGGVWTLHASNVTSPFVQTRTSYGDNTWRVLAKNSVGSTPSNQNTGKSVRPPYVGPPSPVIITETRALIAGTDFPAGTTIQVCLVGGGGGGNRHNVSLFNVWGGLAGTVASGSAGSFNHDVSVVATIGTGGAGVGTHGHVGGPGTASSFGSISGAGSPGGGHAGNNAEVTTCGGTGNDGDASAYVVTWAYGGQSSGFGKGGNGTVAAANGENGGPGCGGGASGYIFAGTLSGTGGRGEIHLSW